MFSGLKKFLNIINVTQTDKDIIVDGIDAETMSRDIAKIWNTSKIATNMFTAIGRYKISFPLFFAPDVVYALNTMISHRSTYSNVKSLNTIKQKILENTWMFDTTVENPNRLDFSKLAEFNYSLMSYQMDFLNYYNKTVPQYNLKGALYAGAAGSGKAQPLDAKIKIPGGWARMGDMKVGSEVIAKDGTVTKVNGVFPQGVKEIFKITFADGRSTECCAEHLWTIIRPKHDNVLFRETVSTAQLIDYINNYAFGSRLHIDLIQSEDNQDIPLKLDPYVLGVYLGDGGSTGKDNTVTITTPDDFIIREVNKTLPDDCKFSIFLHKFKCASYRVIKKVNTGYGTSNTFKKSLIDFKLCGLLSYQKFIPKEYLNASKNQRLALLQGLMDTDGTIDAQGTSSYSTTSKQLALDVQYLVRSLGGIASISTKTPFYTYLGDKKKGRLAYQVNIRYKKPSELFRLPKKKERTNDNNQYAENLRLRIETIESIGFKEAQCISIEHSEKLYVTDDFIVTHNTFGSLALAHCLKAEIIIVVCPKNATERVWESNVINVFKDKQTYWIAQHGKSYDGQRILIAHYEALDKLDDATNNLGNKKIVIILDESHNLNEVTSLRTQKFIDLCKKLKSNDIILASGTPIKALGSESIPLFRAIDPYFTPEVEIRFKKIYGKDANKGLDILSHRLGIVSFKIEKKELQLEPPIMETIAVTMPNSDKYTLGAIAKDMREYTEERFKYFKTREKDDNLFFDECMRIHEATLKDKENKEQFNIYLNYIKMIIKAHANNDLKSVLEEMKFCNSYENKSIIPTLPEDSRKKFKEVKTIVKYVKLKIQGECLGRVLGKKRIQCHVDMIPHIDFAGICNSTLKKTVVFTSFVEALEACETYLKGQDFNPLVVYGKTNNELANTVKRFETDETLNPLIATYNSLSTAVPLIMADTMIMLNSPFRAYIHEQAISRIHRLGADTQTYVYTVILNTGKEPNISSRSVDILQWSQNQVEAIMGIKSPFEINESMESMTITISAESYDIQETLDVSKILAKERRPLLVNW